MSTGWAKKRRIDVLKREGNFKSVATYRISRDSSQSREEIPCMPIGNDNGVGDVGEQRRKPSYLRVYVHRVISAFSNAIAASIHSARACSPTLCTCMTHPSYEVISVKEIEMITLFSDGK